MFRCITVHLIRRISIVTYRRYGFSLITIRNIWFQYLLKIFSGEEMRLLLKVLIGIILLFFVFFNIRVTSSAVNDNAYSTKIPKAGDLVDKKQGIILYEQKVGNLTDEQVNSVWPSTNPRSWIVTGVMDGEITKKYKVWENKYKNQVINTKDKRGLADNTDLSIHIKNLNIKASDFRDIRLIIDYCTMGGTTYLTNLCYAELYIFDNNAKKYGPFHVESFETSGFYIRKQETKDFYEKSYDVLTENLKIQNNTIITEVEIKPYANSPIVNNLTQDGGKNWRGRETRIFAVGGMKIVGYKNAEYKRPGYIKIKKIDVDRVRERTVRRMYDMATIKWVPAVGFGSMYASLAKSNSKVIHPQGSENYGLPYTQRNRATLEKFADEIKNGVLSVPDNITEIWGVDCVASVDYALSKFVPLPVMNLTPDFIWDRNKFTLLGNLKIDGRDNSSEALKQNYSAQEVYEAFAQLQIGDILSTHCQKGAHTRLVTGSTHVARNGDGLIEPESSYVVITETSSALADTSNKNNFGGLINADDYVVPFEPKKEYTDLKELKELEGKNTNFRVNKKITFKQLFNGCYVPLTLNAYLTTSVEEPYVRIINPNTIDNIKNGFKGTIYSNYTILSLTFNIKNAETGENKTFIVYPNHASGTLEGKFNGMYSLYHNTPEEIQNYLKNAIRNVKHFEVLVTVSAGEKENMEVLKLKS